jgi:hypothetical protein
MSMLVRQTEAAGGVGLGVEVNEDCGLIPHDPCVVPGLQHHDRGCCVFEGAAVPVGSVYPTPGQEAHVGMAAKIRTHDGLHVDGPTESGGVHESPDADGAGLDDVDLYTSDLLMGGSRNGTK